MHGGSAILLRALRHPAPVPCGVRCCFFDVNFHVGGAYPSSWKLTSNQGAGFHGRAAGGDALCFFCGRGLAFSAGRSTSIAAAAAALGGWMPSSSSGASTSCEANSSSCSSSWVTIMFFIFHVNQFDLNVASSWVLIILHTFYMYHA